MEKPSEYIDWMPNNSVDDEEPRKIIEPSSEKKLAGWQKNERPPNQQFNWFWQRVGNWLRFFDKSTKQYDATVGSTPDCTHTALGLALEDVGVDSTILMRNGEVLGAGITISKPGVRIYAMPGVTLHRNDPDDGIEDAITCEVAGVEIHGLRFNGFGTGIKLVDGADYCRIMNCNFYDCDTEVDDSGVAAGRKPVVFGSITEELEA